MSTCLLLSSLLTLSQAQITLDGSLGVAGPLAGPHYTIPPSVGQLRGPNLFHSFSQFNLAADESATFTGPSSIVNILGRITGGSPSTINGLIRSQIPGANLYLLNPAGVLFGPNASLDVSGSFHVSTADYLRLADGARFVARLSENSTLSVAPPVAFGFLGPQPATITVQGSTLQVPAGATLSVVGGEVQIVGGQLVAPSGRIQLASVAAAGEVMPVTSGPAPDLQVDSVARLGRIALSQNTLVDASGNGGGVVLIRGGRLLVDGSNIFADNTGPRDGSGVGLDLRIAADAVITHDAFITTDSYIPNNALTMPDSVRAGHARDLRLTAGSVSLDHSLIGSRPSASGDGGKVLVQAGTVTLQGGSISTATDVHSGGNAGSLIMQVGTLALMDGAQIISSTFGAGQGGNLTVIARDTLTLAGESSQGRPSGLFASAERGSSGNAGALQVEAGTLTLSGGAQLSSSTFGSGRAGDIEVTASTVTVTGGAQILNGTSASGQGGRVTIRATEAVTLAGTSPDGALASGIRVGPLGTGQGAGNTGSLGQVTTTVTPDGTLGTAVTQSGALVVVEAPLVMVTGGAQIVGNRTSYDITGGTRLGNGPNLLHSFDRFNVGTNDTVRFSGPSGIENILSRITGGQLSVIDGQLQSIIPGVTLYLLNPSGVLFGPNATLDVSGSFHVSTADYLRLADGARFSAHLADPGMLSATPPVAFGFVSPQPAAISIQGSTLQVPEGATLSVIGGDIAIVGNAGPSSFGTILSPFKNVPVTPVNPAISVPPPTLGAPGGRLHLASVASPGEVALSPVGQPETLRVDAFARLGTLDIRDAILDVHGNRGGTVRLRGGRLVIDNALIDASTRNGNGGGIDLRVTGDLTMRNVSSIEAGTSGTGRGGDITVEVGRLGLLDGAEISTTTSGTGPGGNVSVIATDSITIAGRHRALASFSLSGLVTNALGDGAAGRLLVSTPTLTIEDGIIQALTLGNGRAGNIQLEVGSVTVTGGAQISSSSGATDLSTGKLAVGRGPGGEVRITARDFMAIAGHDQDGTPSGVFTGTSGSGPAGPLALAVPRLHLEEGHIESATTGHGRAGDLMLTVGRLTLASGARITSASTNPAGSGQGGNITIAATEAITITGATSDGAPSALASSTFGSGDAGHIALSAPTLHLDDGGVIAARSTGQGAAGAIRMQVRELFQSQHGTVTSESAGSGNAGTLTVETGRLLLTDGARLSSSTSSTGHGGTIAVTAVDTIRIAGSTVTTSTQSSGEAGRIALTAPTIEVVEGRISAVTSGMGKAGSVVLEAERVTLSGQTQIESSSSGAGPGGQVMITAREALTLTGSGGMASNAASEGAAGTVIITTPTLQMDGPVAIEARTTGAGEAGNVEVHVERLSLTGGARIGSTSGMVDTTGTVIAGPGRGGLVTVTATDALTIAGRDSTGTVASGVFSQTFGAGEAGRVAVSSPHLTMADGGRIGADTGGDGRAGDVMVQGGTLTLTGGAQINSGSGISVGERLLVGAGDGGTVTVMTTDPVRLTGQETGLFTRTAGPGQGGDMTVQARRVALADGATISAESTGLGNAGNVTIATGDTFLSTNGSIVTRAAQADGGNIQITAPTVLRLRESRITAEVGGGAQTVGGNITIDPQFVLLQNSQIIANAFAGKGGNIRLQAQQVFLADPASTVSASSALGINGQVNIQAPVTSISGTVAPLPQSFARAAELLRNRCAERLRGGTTSRLVLGGRDGVPFEPGSWLPSALRPIGHQHTTQSEPMQPTTRTDRVGVLHSDTAGQAQVKGPYAQAHWPGTLDVECTRWIGK